MLYLDSTLQMQLEVFQMIGKRPLLCGYLLVIQLMAELGAVVLIKKGPCKLSWLQITLTMCVKVEGKE